MGDHNDVVRDVAESLGLLDEMGDLMPLDSLMIIDFVVAIESAAKIRVPPAELQPEVFESLDTVAGMLASLLEQRA